MCWIFDLNFLATDDFPLDPPNIFFCRGFWRCTFVQPVCLRMMGKSWRKLEDSQTSDHGPKIRSVGISPAWVRKFDANKTPRSPCNGKTHGGLVDNGGLLTSHAFNSGFCAQPCLHKWLAQPSAPTPETAPLLPQFL